MMGPIKEPTESCRHDRTASWREQALDAWRSADYDKFMKIIRPQLYPYAKSFGLSVVEPEDIVQEALRRVLFYRYLDRVRDGGELAACLIKLVHDAALFLKRQQRNQISLEGIQAGGVDDPASTRFDPVDDRKRPDERAEMSEMEEVITELIELLPDDERVVLILKDVEELTFDEICKTLDLSLGVVRGQLARARQFLQENLKLFGIDDGMAFS